MEISEFCVVFIDQGDWTIILIAIIFKQFFPKTI